MEKWREQYTDDQIQLLQKLELQNLDVITDVCQKLNIEFFLYGGSLIGAVRHGGFVPWDDDLDIAMLRADYMRFVEEAPKYLPENYYLQTPYNDKRSPYVYSKLRLQGTKCVEYIHHKIKTEQGIYVDIYPIDHMPDDEEEFLKQYERFQRMVRLYSLRQSPHPAGPSNSWKRTVRNMIRYLVSRLLTVIPQSFFVRQIDHIMTAHNNIHTQRQGNYSYPLPQNLFYDIYPYEMGEFEGRSVWLPHNWEDHLRMRYGDYMELPPEEERIGHLPYLLDFGVYGN